MERPPRTCLNCGTVFKPSRRVAIAKFCTRKCSAQYRETVKRRLH
jgi:hypothetical protein